MEIEQEIEKYKNEYLSAVEAKQYYVELNPNSGVDHQTQEQRDLDAFREDLKTENFRSLVTEALS